MSNPILRNARRAAGRSARRRRPQNVGAILQPTMDAAWRIHARDQARGAAILIALHRLLYQWRGIALPGEVKGLKNESTRATTGRFRTATVSAT